MRPTFFAMTFLAFMQPFSVPGGPVTEEETYSPSGALLSRTQSVDGRRHGVSLRWYEHGQLESIGSYWSGKKTGLHREWWPNGRLRREASYEADAFHGEYRTWYPSGRPFESRYYVHGREEGRQQSWTESGDVFLNYEVRNGRRYGFVNAKPCLPVGATTLTASAKAMAVQKGRPTIASAKS